MFVSDILVCAEQFCADLVVIVSGPVCRKRHYTDGKI